jgi:hypothetical protein
VAKKKKKKKSSALHYSLFIYIRQKIMSRTDNERLGHATLNFKTLRVLPSLSESFFAFFFLGSGSGT